jgi:hypothetical protein
LPPRWIQLSSFNAGGVTTSLKPILCKDWANPLLKKDRQHNCYTLAYLKNNDTDILPHSFKKTTKFSSI